MFQFGKRKMNKQGGSQIIALPMIWIKGFDRDFTAVNVEMDEQQNLRISPVLAPTVTDDIRHHADEVQNDKRCADN